MKGILRYVLLCLVVSFASACASPDSDVSDDQHASVQDSGEAEDANQTALHAATDNHGALYAANDSTHAALPLRPIMQLLGSNMAAFTHAMLLEDYEQMAVYAHQIADHPHISPEEMTRIRSELGQEMDDFIAADEEVHEVAVRLHAAVEARELDTILQELNEMQVGCMSCHTQFRERLRTDLP